MNYLTLNSFGCTDIGQNRLLNEDYFDMKDSIFVLADGMGGHNAGDIASKIAVENMIDFFDNLDKKGFNSHIKPTSIQKIICDAINKTNEFVFEKSQTNPKLNGMGTTIVLASFQRPNIMHIANVGDSRAYLLRNNILTILTEDHSVTATMLRNGTITPTEAKIHPYRHHLTKSIGTSDKVKAYTYFFTLAPEDKILLCSDGLWNVLSDKKIVELLQKQISPEKICKKLIDKANDLQSMDNISSIVITVSKNDL